MSVGVVLSGCGVYDGTEVHEAAAVCSALTRAGKTPVFYAPSMKLYHEINHVRGTDNPDSDRNVLVESGRIARGKVLELSELTSNDVEALVFPGGFGAAKNLSTFGVSDQPEVNEDVARVLREFNEAGKPIGMMCIAPVLAAMVFSRDDGKAVKLTLGRRERSEGEEGSWPFASALDKVAEMSQAVELVEAGVDEVVVDEDNKLFTTPAFMYDGKFHQIHDGVAKMIQSLVESI